MIKSKTYTRSWAEQPQPFLAPQVLYLGSNIVVLWTLIVGLYANYLLNTLPGHNGHMPAPGEPESKCSGTGWTEVRTQLEATNLRDAHVTAQL